MSLFKGSSNPKFAGCALVFAFEAIGDLELDTQQLSAEETSRMAVTAATAAEACGHDGLSVEEFVDQMAAWAEWIRQSQPSFEKIIGSLVTAGNTLKANWRDDSRKEHFLTGIMAIAAADGTVTDNEKKLLLHVATLIDATDVLMKMFED